MYHQKHRGKVITFRQACGGDACRVLYAANPMRLMSLSLSVLILVGAVIAVPSASGGAVGVVSGHTTNGHPQGVPVPAIVECGLDPQVLGERISTRRANCECNIRVVGHHQAAFQALRCLNTNQRTRSCKNKAKKVQKSFLPSSVRVYSLAMNPTQKQFSVTGVEP
jgi:hypothetical protein